MNLRIKQSLPLIPGALPLKSGGAPETRGTRFPHIDDRHKNFEIALEIAEIIEVEVGNHHLEIGIVLFHRGRKIISMLKVATLTCSQLFLNQFSKFLNE